MSSIILPVKLKMDYTVYRSLTPAVNLMGSSPKYQNFLKLLKIPIQYV